MSQESVESITGDIDDMDIQEMSDKTGIEEEYIESAVESQRADELYKEAQEDVNVGSKDYSYTNKVSNGIRFVLSQLIRNPTLPKKAEVISVSSPENSNKITIKTEADYAPLPNKSNAETHIKEFDFHIKTDKKELDYIINKVGVNAPSELEEKFVPIKPTDDGSCYGAAGPDYQLPTPNNTIKEKVGYYGSRLLYNLKCFERKGVHDNKDYRGQYVANRNTHLTLAFSVFPLIIVFAQFPLLEPVVGFLIFFSMFFFLGYIIALGHGILRALLEVTTKEPENREYIKASMNK